MEFSMSWMMEHFYNAFMVHNYKDICHQYTEYVARKLVVFDGYESTDTKDMTYQR